MCTVSMIGDGFQERWKDKFPPYIPNQVTQPLTPVNVTYWVTKEDFEALKKEVEIMKDLLKRAKIYDEQNGEPNCEMEDKVKFLKEIAKAVGVDLSEIFGK